MMYLFIWAQRKELGFIRLEVGHEHEKRQVLSMKSMNEFMGRVKVLKIIREGLSGRLCSEAAVRAGEVM